MTSAEVYERFARRTPSGATLTGLWVKAQPEFGETPVLFFPDGLPY